MSGTSVNFPAPILLDTVPPATEGSKCVTVKINWQTVYNQTGAFTTPINLLSQFQTGQFSTVQAVYVDNTTCPEMVTLTCTDTGLTIRIPPFAKGLYPLISGQSPGFSATLNLNFDPVYGQAYSNCSTSFFFLNTPQRGYFEALASSFGQNFNNYWNAISFGAAVTQVQLAAPTGGTGNGLSTLGANELIAINSLSYTMYNSSAFSSAGAIQFGLEEKDHSGPFFKYLSRAWIASNTQVGLITSGTLTFPTPLMQIDPLNNFYWNVGPVPAAANSLVVVLNITYSVLTVQ